MNLALANTRLLHILLTVGVAAALRGVTDDEQHPNRHLMVSGTECVTYMKVIDFQDKPDEESWSCEFSHEDAKRFGGIRMLEIDGISSEEMKAKHAISGGTVLKVGSTSYVETPHKDNIFEREFGTAATSDSVVAAASPVLHVSSDDDYTIEEMDEYTDSRHYKNRRGRRRLAPTTGTLNTLVMRVIDVDGVAPPNAQDLEDDVFLDTVSLKTQYGKCSHGNIDIQQADEPGFVASYEGEDYKGIIDVQMTYKAGDADRYGLWEDAIAVAETQYNDGKNIENTFDLIMVCYPPGVGSGWIAYAYINHYVSVYNNNWCRYVSGQMHEVGHNLGLLHAGEKGQSQYSDQTGVMGYSYSQDDGPYMCFNAAKGYQLGWYPNQMTSVDPLKLPGGVQTYTLNGVVDYGNSDGYVTIRLDYTGQTYQGVDFYMGYNRATDFNSGTITGAGKVQIFEKRNDGGDRNGPGQSYLLQSLGAGQSYTWNVGGTDVTVEVLSIVDKDAVITLTGGAAPVEPSEPPTQAPTSAPTRAPTSTPTRAPTAEPTFAPTLAPTSMPTFAPTSAPTSMPTRAPTSAPTSMPTRAPTAQPTDPVSPVQPSEEPTQSPSVSQHPSQSPSRSPSRGPTAEPTQEPTLSPTLSPTREPTGLPTQSPTREPTRPPTPKPTKQPTTTTLKICKRKDTTKTFTLKGNGKSMTCTELASKPVGTQKKLCRKKALLFGRYRRVHQRCPRTCGLVKVGKCKNKQIL